METLRCVLLEQRACFGHAFEILETGGKRLGMRGVYSQMSYLYVFAPRDKNNISDDDLIADTGLWQYDPPSAAYLGAAS